MKVRAYESVTMFVGNQPVVPGWYLANWKNLLSVGIVRAVNVTGRNLYNWDAQPAWEKVPAQPDHAVVVTDIEFHTYKHGGKTELQAVYYFDIDA